MTTREDLDQEISTVDKQIDKICVTLVELRYLKHTDRVNNAIEFWESRLSKLMDYRRTLR